MALYHFATSDLPNDTIAPELDDRNAAVSLKADAELTGEDRSAGAGVSEEVMGNYLAYLVGVGFLPPPPKTGKKTIPQANISNAQKQALVRVGGRGALV